MTDAFNLFFVKLAPLLLTDLLNQFEWCVLQDNDQLARSASSCLETLVNISPNPLNFIEKQNLVSQNCACWLRKELPWPMYLQTWA